MSPVSEGVQFKDSSPGEGLNERYKGTEGWGLLAEPEISRIFWRRLQRKGVLLESTISLALWGRTWEKTQVCVPKQQCKYFPWDSPEDKDGATEI
jgi:hypothetical protein